MEVYIEMDIVECIMILAVVEVLNVNYNILMRPSMVEKAISGC